MLAQLGIHFLQVLPHKLSRTFLREQIQDNPMFEESSKSKKGEEKAQHLVGFKPTTS